MKKLDFSFLKNVEKEKMKIINFLKKIDLENICKMSVCPETLLDDNYTLFVFETNIDETIQFYYESNQKVMNIRIWEGKNYVGHIIIDKNETWLNAVWEQFVDHFNLRIRLLFINKTTPWKWNTKFTY